MVEFSSTSRAFDLGNEIMALSPLHNDSITPATTTITSDSALMLMGEMSPHVPRGYGLTQRIERLRTVREQDPEVNRLIDSLIQKLGTNSSSPTLASELQIPGSISREVINSYLEWLAHRGPKEAAVSEADQKQLKALDSALLKTRVDAIIDLTLARIVELNCPIPEAAAKGFLALFHGAAGRIQAQADTWMMNEIVEIRWKEDGAIEVYRERDERPKPAVGDRIERKSGIEFIYEMERTLATATPIDQEQLFLVPRVLHLLDGGSPFGFQKPLEPGQWRLTAGGRVEAGFLPAILQSSSLVHAGTNLALATQARSIINIVQQSPQTGAAIAKIEARLAELAPGSPEHTECTDAYKAYTAYTLYDSRKLWQSRGVVDRLFESSITVGTKEQRQAVLELIYGGLDEIRKVLHTDFSRAQVTYRHLFLGITNLILGREKLDQEALGFALEKLFWLQSIKNGKDLPPEAAANTYEEIIQMRRKEIPDFTQVIALLKGAPNVSRQVKVGAYSATLTLREHAATGIRGKVLETKDLSTELPEDTETFYTIALLEKVAREQGCNALQLAEWSNIHQARMLRGSGDFQEVTRPNDSHGRSSDPTFIKNLVSTRASFQEYMASQFASAEKLDLSPESALVGENAHRFKQNLGGKALGLAALGKLLQEFGNQRLQCLPFLNATAEELQNGIAIPGTFPKDFDTAYLIARSNAGFEYGCPPGILSSRSRIKLSKDQKLQLDVGTQRDEFNHVVDEFGLDSRASLRFLIQPQILPRASGIIYSSFSARTEEPVIIEASTGPCLSATAGIANLVHYRVGQDQIKTHRNFAGRTPGVLFIGETVYIDPSVVDLSRRELDLYQSAASNIRAESSREVARLWAENTFSLPSEPHSPLKEDEISILSQFSKFAESKLGRPLKFEFAIANDGTIYILQLDPAMLEVDNNPVDLERKEGSLFIETPFVNMPIRANGIHVVLEAVPGARDVPKGEPFVYISETDPLNVNIQNDLTRYYPNCVGIITASGSRMNHTYSEARTFIPLIGCVDLYKLLKRWDEKRTWGYDPQMKIDISSDGRFATVQLYKVSPD